MDIGEKILTIAFLVLAAAVAIYLIVALLPLPVRVRSTKKKRKTPRVLKPRTCPMCGSKLGPHDVLYGEVIREKPTMHIVIKGCNHCYKPDYK